MKQLDQQPSQVIAPQPVTVEETSPLVEQLQEKAKKLQRQAEQLQDSVIVYHERRPAEVSNVDLFSGWKEVGEALAQGLEDQGMAQHARWQHACAEVFINNGYSEEDAYRLSAMVFETCGRDFSKNPIILAEDEIFIRQHDELEVENVLMEPAFIQELEADNTTKKEWSVEAVMAATGGSQADAVCDLFLLYASELKIFSENSGNLGLEVNQNVVTESLLVTTKVGIDLSEATENIVNRILKMRWIERCADTLIKQGCDEKTSFNFAEALHDDYKLDDPVDIAEEEMSCWGD